MTTATQIILFVEMTFALWLALYLLGRGYASGSTRRAVIALLSVALAAYLSYLNLSHPVPNLGGWWAALVTLALLAWYRLIFKLLPRPIRRRRTGLHWGIMAIGGLKIGLLILWRERLPVMNEDTLWLAAGPSAVAALLDVAFVSVTVASLLYNVYGSVQTKIWPAFRSLWVGCLFGVAGLGYGTLAPLAPAPLPRWPMDLLLFAIVATLGYTVARYQALVLQRVSLRELPLTALTIGVFTAIYLLYAMSLGLTDDQLGSLAVLVVLTHSFYDLLREAIDQWRQQNDSAFRQQMRALAHSLDEDLSLEASLQAGLETVCGMLQATGGCLAARKGEDFSVTVTTRSLPLGHTLPASIARIPEMTQPEGKLYRLTPWLVPVQVNGEQLAVIGIGPRLNASPYTDQHLDRLDELADWAGKLLLAHQQQTAGQNQIQQKVDEIQVIHERAHQLRQHTEALWDSLVDQPPEAFVEAVQEGLRRLNDYAALAGNAALGSLLKMPGATSVERGRALRETLIRAVEALRPTGNRPAGVLPKEWYAYAILNDAYIEDVPNREIMARLYISEGTFNRQRRKAVQAVARSLLESAQPEARPGLALDALGE